MKRRIGALAILLAGLLAACTDVYGGSADPLPSTGPSPSPTLGPNQYTLIIDGPGTVKALYPIGTTSRMNFDGTSYDVWNYESMTLSLPYVGTINCPIKNPGATRVSIRLSANTEAGTFRATVISPNSTISKEITVPASASTGLGASEPYNYAFLNLIGDI